MAELSYQTSSRGAAPRQTLTNEGGRRTKGLCKVSSAGKPLISILTVVLNADRLIETTLKSIAAQTYDNVDYVVMDGGSTDGTVDLLRSYSDVIDYWVSEPDKGLYDAMNKAAAHCLGDLIGVIGAGDWYDPDAVANIANRYLATDADLIYGDVFVVDAQTGYEVWRKSDAVGMPITMSSISHPSTFTRRSLMGKKPFDTHFSIAADYDLCLRLYVRGCRFEHAGATIIHMLAGGVSGASKTLGEVYAIHRRYYGRAYAIRHFVGPFLCMKALLCRRRLLKSLLPGALFNRVRAWWLRP